MPTTAEVWSTVLITAVALALSAPAQGVVVKVDLFRKNSNLDKSKARASRNVLCESQPHVLLATAQSCAWCALQSSVSHAAVSAVWRVLGSREW